MEAAPDDFEAIASYAIISYPANAIPEEYKGMIFSKWLRSLRFGNDWFKLIDSRAYYAKYHKAIENILARPLSVVRFAVLSDDHGIVLGFSLVENNILHYVHVHRDHRHCGIAKALVPRGIEYITHLTKIGASIWSSKLPNAKFDPFY